MRVIESTRLQRRCGLGATLANFIRLIDVAERGGWRDIKHCYHVRHGICSWRGKRLRMALWRWYSVTQAPSGDGGLVNAGTAVDAGAEPVHLAFAILPPIQQVAPESTHHPQPAGIIDQLIQHY